MDFTEFKRLLGAEPRCRDPEFLRARESSPEFRAAADDAERFEETLEAALSLPAPDELVTGLQSIAGKRSPIQRPRSAWGFALAAGLLLAVGSTLVYRQLNPPWNSVEDYVAVHYRHDGASLLERHIDGAPLEAGAMLADHGLSLESGMASLINVVKACPTPDGKGVHMVLDTGQGLVTVIVMPNTAVPDGEHLAFDGLEAVLVALQSGSAAIVGAAEQDLSTAVALVQSSVLPAPART